MKKMGCYIVGGKIVGGKVLGKELIRMNTEIDHFVELDGGD